MSGPGAGFEYPPREVSWLKRDVLLFANSIGCTADELHFLYVRFHSQKQAANSNQGRNCIQTLPSSQHIPLFCVSSENSPSSHQPRQLLTATSLQKQYPGSHRLLRQPVLNSHPRRSQIRLAPRCRWPAPHYLPQAAPADLRRQDI